MNLLIISKTIIRIEDCINDDEKIYERGVIDLSYIKYELNEK